MKGSPDSGCWEGKIDGCRQDGGIHCGEQLCCGKFGIKRGDAWGLMKAKTKTLMGEDHGAQKFIRCR